MLLHALTVVHMSSGSVDPAGYRVDELTELRQREKELGIAPDPAVDAYMKVGSSATQLQLGLCM